MEKKVIERFYGKVMTIPYHSCWEWVGNINTTGYGRLWNNGKNHNTHRLSYRIHKGEIPKGMMVCHTCDNRSCVNPDHLFLGNAKDNMQDMIKKGRGRGQFSSDRPSPRRKLTSRQVEEIREYYRKKGNIIGLPKKYGVGRHTLQSIYKHKTYKV